MGAEVFSWLLLAAHVLIVLVAAVLISANRKPSAAIAWMEPRYSSISSAELPPTIGSEPSVWFIVTSGASQVGHSSR